MKKYCFFFSAVVFLVGCILLYDKANDGFSIRAIKSTIRNQAIASQPLSNVQLEHIHAIMAQPYHYLGKGCQFYVFESADKKHILKFFKHKHLRTYEEFESWTLPAFIKTKIVQKNAQKNTYIAKIFESCQLAYEYLPQYTGLEHIHLRTSQELQQQVSIIDQLGIIHQINIDDYEYLLQKRAIAAKDYIQSVAGDSVKIQTMLNQLAQAFIARASKGIIDEDKASVQNLGYLEEEQQWIFTDCGSLGQNPQACLIEYQRNELHQRFNSLKIWAQAKHPEWVPLIDSQLQQF